MTMVGHAEESGFCSNSTIFGYYFVLHAPLPKDLPVLLLNQLISLYSEPVIENCNEHINFKKQYLIRITGTPFPWKLEGP